MPHIVGGLERLPDSVVTRRRHVASVRPAAQLKQILLGDLHVRTTYSTDAFQWALPLNGGPGSVRPGARRRVRERADRARAAAQSAAAGAGLLWLATRAAARLPAKTREIGFAATCAGLALVGSFWFVARTIA